MGLQTAWRRSPTPTRNSVFIVDYFPSCTVMTTGWLRLTAISRLALTNSRPSNIILNSTRLPYNSGGRESLCSSASGPSDSSKSPNYARQFLEDPAERLVNVILLNEAGAEVGQMSKSAARDVARDRNLRLVEVKKQSGQERPAIFQLMTGEILAKEREKIREKKREAKANHSIGVEKQLRINSSIAEADLRIKMAQITKWLGHGNTVRVTISAESPDEVGKMKKVFVSVKDYSKAKVLQVQETEHQIVFRLKSAPNESSAS